jgi:hypothetical protein
MKDFKRQNKTFLQWLFYVKSDFYAAEGTNWIANTKINNNNLNSTQ